MADEALLPLEAIRQARQRVMPHLIETPLVPWYGGGLPWLLGAGTRVSVKLELMQRTGSFKPRGALNVMMLLDAEARARGVTAVSAGNHAIAVAYAARQLGTTAKVAMPRKASQYRVAQCLGYGAEVSLAEDIAGAFTEGMRLRDEEGRALIHPFEGPHTVAGTGIIGLEIAEQAPDVDAVIVPIGGGGLIAGIAAALKQVKPGIAVYGVEPAGARGMSDSLAAGAPAAKVHVDTIADSLGAPLHTQGTFDLVRAYVDDVVVVDDQAMIDAMDLSFRDLKLAVEPAGASALAALLGPLKAELAGRHVVVLACGSNIDPQSYCALMARARPHGG
ncbi:MAG: pyridoxal-phosphate dependent enzyme [Alphaproteobacteria bacterium]